MSVRRPPRSARAAPAKLPVPPLAVALSAVAMVFLGAGAIGLLTPETLPLVARPVVAWSLVGAGALMDAGAVLMLLSTRRGKSRQASSVRSP